MSLTLSDFVWRKSAIITDTAGNGGRRGRDVVSPGVRHSIFPRVTRAERAAGVTRYRKAYLCNEDGEDATAYDPLVWLELPSDPADVYSLGEGTHTDTQAQMLAAPPLWLACGQLAASLAGGETEVQLTMEEAGLPFDNGGILHLASKILTGQTIAAGVRAGESVQLSAGTWQRIAASQDIVHPKGVFCGSGRVLTLQDSTAEEWLAIADKLTTGEVIGAGEASTGPAISGLANATNGIVVHPDHAPVIMATCGGVTRTVAVGPDGICTGYCTAGELDPETGAWVEEIVWTTAVDSGTDITATYHERCYSYAGNVATIELSDQVAHAYATASTFGAGCVQAASMPAEIQDITVSSTAGTYDDAGYPVVLHNDGVEYEQVTVTMLTATTFQVSGLYLGDLGTGSTAADFSPASPYTGQPLFVLRSLGWGGTWQAGETITFTTTPAALPLWLRQVVPAGAAAADDSLLMLGWRCE